MTIKWRLCYTDTMFLLTFLQLHILLSAMPVLAGWGLPPNHPLLEYTVYQSYYNSVAQGDPEAAAQSQQETAAKQSSAALLSHIWREPASLAGRLPRPCSFALTHQVFDLASAPTRAP